MSNNNGWICLHRSILEWEHWSEPNHVAKVFITLLLCANHKRKWWHGIRCERGETLVTVERLCEMTGLSKPTIIKALRILEDSGELTRRSIDQKHTNTTIKKYNEYQANIPVSGKNTLPQSLPQTLPQSLPKQQLNNDNNIVVVDNVRTKEKIVAEFMANDITIEQFCMSNHITKDQCRRMADDIVNEWQLTGKINSHKNVMDERKHLISQIRIKIEAERKAKANQSKAEQRKAWEEDLMRGAMQTLNDIYNN